MDKERRQRGLGVRIKKPRLDSPEPNYEKLSSARESERGSEKDREDR